MPASFADLGVPADLIATLAVRSISEPFPIQTLTLPDALAGRDVCGRAPTGSGKTLAFGLAAVARLDRRAKPRRPLALVLTPTRELCAQVAAELAPLAAARGRRVATFYGGVGYGAQMRALKAGVDIAVACPGRLADLAGSGAISLHDVGVVVVDEADRMADMGFLPEVRRLLDQTRSDRQTMLFSATLDGDVDVLVRHYQRDPARHVLENDEAGAARAEHVFWRVEGPNRIGLAAAIVAARGATMVFCRTKHGTDRAAKQLTAKGVRAAAIHGDRSQAQRERALAAFAAGHVDVLVATDVAARGIHVEGVAAIVHFDPPTDAKDYLHRSGRTARAGASGLIVSFVTDEKSKAVMRMQRDLSFPVGAGAPDLASLAVTTPPRRSSSAQPGRAERPGVQPARAPQPARARQPGRRDATRSGPRPVTDVSQRRRRRHTGKPVPDRSARARRTG